MTTKAWYDNHPIFKPFTGNAYYVVLYNVILTVNYTYTVSMYTCWEFSMNVFAGNSDAAGMDMTSTLPSSSSSSTSHFCTLPSLIAAATAAAAAAASVNVTAPPSLATDFHYHKLYGHLLNLAGSISHSPSHVAQCDTHDLRYEDDVGHKLDSRRTAFERYHPYLCRP